MDVLVEDGLEVAVSILEQKLAYPLATISAE